ncbi:hypothetical protein [Streptomyces sp. NPDC002533]
MGPGHHTVVVQQALETLLDGSIGAGEDGVEDGLTVGFGAVHEWNLLPH